MPPFRLIIFFRPVQEKKKTVPSKRIDLGAAANWSAPAVTPQAAPQQAQGMKRPNLKKLTVSAASTDLFSLDSTPQAAPAAASSGGSFWDEAPAQPAQPATQQFDAFADFSSPQQPQAPPPQGMR